MRVGTYPETAAHARSRSRVERFELVAESVVLWIDHKMGIPSPTAPTENALP